MEACSSGGPALLNFKDVLERPSVPRGAPWRWIGGGVGEKATQEGAGKGTERPACRAPSPELNCPELRLERGAPSQQTFLGTAPPLVPVSGLRVGGGFWIVCSDLELKVARSGLTFPPHDSQRFFGFVFVFLVSRKMNL